MKKKRTTNFFNSTHVHNKTFIFEICFLGKFNLLTTPLQRIVAGGLLVCLAFVTSGVLEIFLEVLNFSISNFIKKTLKLCMTDSSTGCHRAFFSYCFFSNKSEIAQESIIFFMLKRFGFVTLVGYLSSRIFFLKQPTQDGVDDVIKNWNESQNK